MSEESKKCSAVMSDFNSLSLISGGILMQGDNNRASTKWNPQAANRVC